MVSLTPRRRQVRPKQPTSQQPGMEKTKETKIREEKAIDLTEIATYAAVVFMLYRIGYLVNIYLNHEDPPNPDWLQDYAAKPLEDYSSLPGIRSTSGRTFLKYVPSPYEQKWADGMDSFVRSDSVCGQVSVDTDLIRRFFNATCTSMANETQLSNKDHRGWCILDDGTMPLFFNTLSGKISGARPSPLKTVDFLTPQPVVPSDDVVFSKFVYRSTDNEDEIQLDYIEPLVNRLRHPMDCCEHVYKIGANLKKPPENCKVNQRLGVSKTQYVPPPPEHLDGFRQYTYIDVGPQDWRRGKSDLAYFRKIWQRHGIEFHSIRAYHIEQTDRPAISKDKFLSTLPEDLNNKVAYHVGVDDIISEIVTKTDKDDYVLLKLDFLDEDKELQVLTELMDNKDGVLDHVDELFYSFPVELNATTVSYGKWYSRFLKLRQAGVRAHSWSKNLF